VAGALAERVFAEKLHRAGFTHVWVGGHRPTGIDEAADYPLFTEDVIELMRRALPADRHDRVATGVIVKARKSEHPDPVSSELIDGRPQEVE
jgi:arsenite methyltransferase